MDINNILRGFSVRRVGGKLAQDRLVKYLNIGLLAALAIVSLLLVRDGIRYWYSGENAGEQEQQDARSRAAALQRRPLGTYAPVVQDNVFGIKGAKFKPLTSAAVTTGSAAAVPSSLEHIKLLGAVAWADGFGYAFITGRSGEQEVYKTGQNIEGAGDLVAVFPMSIVIKTTGGDVEIPLEEVVAEVVSSSRKTERLSSSRDRNRRVAQDFARQTSDTSFVVNQQAVEESIENPQNIMTDARLVPNMVDGQQKGFVLKEVKKPGIYHSLGLENGDILMSVNEFKLSNPEAALQAFTALKGMDYIELNIVRNGTPMTLTYSLR